MQSTFRVYFHAKRERVRVPFLHGADERTRTADLILTKDALYLLSYTSTCPRKFFSAFTL